MQASLWVKVPAAALHIVEMHPHLLRKWLAMVARGVCEVEPSRLFRIFVAHWSNVSITLPVNMLVAQRTSITGTFWPQPYAEDETNMTQLYKEAEAKKEKLKWHYALS